jgi:adenylate kinase family enzyme
LELPHIELDAINWQAGWRDLTRHDPEEFVRRVNEAIRAEAWVLDGNYGPVRDRVWPRATHLVWLDYGRPVIMARVISRTLFRAVLRTELWAGNRERWRQLLRPSHPIRWAWSNLGAPPPRNRGAPGGEGMRTSRCVSAAPPERSNADRRAPGEGGWRTKGA